MFKKNIEEEIQKRKFFYKQFPDDMISAYNRELGTEKDYNGRQLLELLQNADDQESDEVLIELDTKQKILKIANRGKKCKPFSIGGIKSLMISNLSPKVTKKYIGNKGLGFRSIVNWSEEININSNNMDIVFSREIVDEIYNELFNKKKQIEILEQRKLPENIKPIPFLAIPKINENTQDNWTTIILIKYEKEYLDDIKNQINDLKDEVLLFLNHIRKLEIKVDDKIKSIEKIQKNKSIYINEKKYTIYPKSDILPLKLWDKENEEEYFDLKIAMQDGFESRTNLLFSYFPTKIDINFPFIIHGTFDLNSSRDTLNNNEKNKYILKKLVELITETAKSLTEGNVSYKALQILTYEKPNPNNILNRLGFYHEIDNSIQTLEIFPCLDNSYKTKDKVVKRDGKLIDLIQNTNNQNLFPNILIPLDIDLDIKRYNLSTSLHIQKLNKLSALISDIDDRAELIYVFKNTMSGKNKFVLLTDSDENLVSLDDEVYTPPEISFNIPDFINIKFIHGELFEKLIKKFGIRSNEKASDLKKKLEDITNIQCYDPVQVLQKIVTSTNKELKKDGINKIKIIRKMVSSLYENYKILDEDIKIPSNTEIQLINRDNNIVNAKNMYLSKSYPIGMLTEEIFEGIFENSQFLADAETYNFNQNEDIKQIERFFLWLGVNKYTKFNDISRDFKYNRFICNEIGAPENYSSWSFVDTIIGINGFENIIKTISIEKLILWIIKDEFIKKELDEKYETKYIKKGGYIKYHYSYNTPSYILYQLISSKFFEDYLITNEKLDSILNKISFNYDSEIFNRYNINRPDIESIMLKIGAKDKFEKLSFDRVVEIIKDLPEKSLDGKHCQTIYKLAIKHYNKNKKKLANNQIRLFAKQEGESKYYKQSEVYYNGSIKLPKKLTNSKAMFNYPRRQNTKNVVEFFGINNLENLKIKIIHKDIIDDITNKFDMFFKQIMPYILVYRIKDIEAEKTARAEINKLNKASIILCENVIYQINNQEFELETNDYIKDKNTFFIKIDKNLSLEDLKQDFNFSDTFEDIIGLVFDITDTEVFSRLLKDDFSYVEKSIRKYIGEDEVARAKDLLGISDEFYSFWKTIYTLKDKYYNYNFGDNLLQNVKEDLKIWTGIEKIDFDNLRNLKNFECIEKLFNELNLEVEDFNKSKFSYYKLDFQKYHSKNLEQTFDNSLKVFKQNLYHWCINNQQEEEFLNLIGKYEHNEDFIERKSRELKERLNINYQGIVTEFILEKFNLELLSSFKHEINFDEVYDKNKAEIEFDKIDDSNKYMSLLYFKNKLKEIKKFINKQNEKENAIKTDEINKTINKSIVEITTSSPNKENISKLKIKKPFKHSFKREKSKSEVGYKSEEYVYNELVKKFGLDNVEWVSRRDDTLGYDIKYKNEEGTWKCVEIKKYSNNKFYLSENEKKFAEKNLEKYELFLVGDEIYKIKKPDFKDEKKFTVTLKKEYIVEYDVKND